MTSITPYGGVGEIGGNQILLTSEEGRYFLDFGLSFGRQQELFSEYMKPRVAKGLGDYLDSGLVPEMKGLYREDLLKPVERMKYEEPTVNGVLLSHAHLDHCGLVSLVDWRIPVFCSQTTEKIMSVTTTIKGAVDRELTQVKKRPYGRYTSSYPTESKKIKRLSGVTELEVEGHPVDHSTHGSRGMIIHTSGGTVAYTGDLRLNGPRSELTEEYIERLKNTDIDVLLVEGTRVGESEPDEETRMLAGELHEKLESEGEVKEKCVDLISESEEPVFLDFAKRDFDRFLTFYQVAEEVGRKLAIPIDLAYYIDELAEPSFIEQIKSETSEEAEPKRPESWLGMDSKDEQLVVFTRRKGLSAYDEREYYLWERPYLNQGNAKKSDWIKDNMRNLLIFADYWHIQELLDLKPSRGRYIHSVSEPFNEEKAINFKKLKNWLDMLGLSYEYMHTSGHLSQEEVFALCEEVDAKKIVPVHTEGSKIFEKQFDNVILPKLGKPISL